MPSEMMDAFERARTGTIRTWKDFYVEPLNMQPGDVDVEDLAHSLARLCRYNGHCGGFISVARHSIWVAEHLKYEGKRMQLWGLMHDAPEAYLGDLVRPVKKQPSMHEFVEADERLEKVIATRFGLPHPMPQVVHDADMYVFNEIELPILETYHGDYRTDEKDFLDLYLKLELNP